MCMTTVVTGEMVHRHGVRLSVVLVSEDRLYLLMEHTYIQNMKFIYLPFYTQMVQPCPPLDARQKLTIKFNINSSCIMYVHCQLMEHTTVSSLSFYTQMVQLCPPLDARQKLNVNSCIVYVHCTAYVCIVCPRCTVCYQMCLHETSCNGMLGELLRLTL